MRKTRPKVGLALGGGAARGFAHIGVLKVLEENDIPIDYIAGASMGAIIGAHYALHKNVPLLEHIAVKLRKRDMVKLIRFNSLKKSLISGRKIDLFLRELMQDKSFSDTKIKFKLVTTDIIRGDEVILSKGNIVDALNASYCIPGIFEPVKIGNKYLVDGGVVNNTPANVVEKMGADIVIAVDLTIKSVPVINDFTLFKTLNQTFEIFRIQSTKKILKQSKDAIIINPKFKKTDSLKFQDVERFIKLGEKVAEKALPKIKRRLK